VLVVLLLGWLRDGRASSAFGVRSASLLPRRLGLTAAPELLVLPLSRFLLLLLLLLLPSPLLVLMLLDV
jgi:hypothetical protein